MIVYTNNNKISCIVQKAKKYNILFDFCKVIWGADFRNGELTIPISKQTKCTALNSAN